MADTDFHMISSSDNSGDESVNMTQSQVIEKPELQDIAVQNCDTSQAQTPLVVKTISLKEITELVNKQTLRGYKAGYEDGYADGTHVNDFFTFGYGISLGLSLAGTIILCMKQ